MKKIQEFRFKNLNYIRFRFIMHRGSRWFCCQFLSLGDRKVTYSDADTLSKTTRDTATLATCDRIFNVGLIGKCTFFG